MSILIVNWPLVSTHLPSKVILFHHFTRDVKKPTSTEQFVNMGCYKKVSEIHLTLIRKHIYTKIQNLFINEEGGVCNHVVVKLVPHLYYHATDLALRQFLWITVQTVPMYLCWLNKWEDPGSTPVL